MSDFHNRNVGVTVGKRGAKTLKFNILTLSAIFAALIGAFASPGTSSAASLTSASVTFKVPPGDGKDASTAVGFGVNCDGRQVAVAESIAPGQEFKEEKSYGPFPLKIVGSLEKMEHFEMSSRCKAVLAIATAGKDRWITKAEISFMFSDGSTQQGGEESYFFDEQTKRIDRTFYWK